MNSRITFYTLFTEMPDIMSGENPRAKEILVDMIGSSPTAITDITRMDSLGIYDEDICTLFQNCNQDFKKLNEVTEEMYKKKD